MDLLYLGLMAAPVLLKVFPTDLRRPVSAFAVVRTRLLMWYRTGLDCGALRFEGWKESILASFRTKGMVRWPSKLRLLSCPWVCSLASG